MHDSGEKYRNDAFVLQDILAIRKQPFQSKVQPFDEVPIRAQKKPDIYREPPPVNSP